MDERQITQWTSDSSAPNSFQVVRQEFFSHTREPMLTFSRCRIHVNEVCLTKFEGAMGVQVLIDQEARVLALRPGQEGMRDVWPWCGVSGGKRRPRQTACRLFFAKVASMMGWSPDCRYRVLGRLVRANGGGVSPGRRPLRAGLSGELAGFLRPPGAGTPPLPGGAYL